MTVLGTDRQIDQNKYPPPTFRNGGTIKICIRDSVLYKKMLRDILIKTIIFGLENTLLWNFILQDKFHQSVLFKFS